MFRRLRSPRRSAASQPIHPWDRKPRFAAVAVPLAVAGVVAVASAGAPPAHAASTCSVDPTLNICVSPTPIYIRIEGGYVNGFKYVESQPMTLANGNAVTVKVFTFDQLRTYYHDDYDTNNITIAAGLSPDLTSSSYYPSRSSVNAAKTVITAGDLSFLGSPGSKTAFYGEVLHLGIPIFGFCTGFTAFATWNIVSQTNICDVTIKAYAVRSFRYDFAAQTTQSVADLDWLSVVAQ